MQMRRKLFAAERSAVNGEGLARCSGTHSKMCWSTCCEGCLVDRDRSRRDVDGEWK
ncbi:hypothetical protein CERSUDRAFT_119623 [Gelatoporia subvermispora B]|uniref:Uncharacterized protein n=1 Tax=Ceriporiopsis subvermispora (strain B) TaxID=914234 RepID=M2Q460_CERS8|nr:hypothetical protein CERSUDRAFT_119623 [Gelatoporia subvermispora B]